MARRAWVSAEAVGPPATATATGGIFRRTRPPHGRALPPRAGGRQAFPALRARQRARDVPGRPARHGRPTCREPCFPAPRRQAEARRGGAGRGGGPGAANQSQPGGFPPMCSCLRTCRSRLPAVGGAAGRVCRWVTARGARGRESFVPGPAASASPEPGEPGALSRRAAMLMLDCSSEVSLGQGRFCPTGSPAAELLASGVCLELLPDGLGRCRCRSVLLVKRLKAKKSHAWLASLKRAVSRNTKVR